MITGAFSPKCLEVLKILSSQLTISLENALLYQTLEPKVAKRTAQLAQANTQLTATNEEMTTLNEQLKPENLRMNAKLEVSRHRQKMRLPKDKELEQINGLDIAYFMEPAEGITKNLATIEI